MAIRAVLIGETLNTEVRRHLAHLAVEAVRVGGTPNTLPARANARAAVLVIATLNTGLVLAELRSRAVAVGETTHTGLFTGLADGISRVGAVCVTKAFNTRLGGAITHTGWTIPGDVAGHATVGREVANPVAAVGIPCALNTTILFRKTYTADTVRGCAALDTREVLTHPCATLRVGFAGGASSLVHQTPTCSALGVRGALDTTVA